MTHGWDSRRGEHSRPIKAHLGKIDAGPAELAAAIAPSGFLQLLVSAADATGVALLEAHHDDLFDRQLIAQALAEPLELETADAMLAMYCELVVVA